MTSAARDQDLEQARHYVVGADRAAVIPSASNPKLLVPLCAGKTRWRASALYPAFKPRAKPWRFLQRSRALWGLAPHLHAVEHPAVREFVSDFFPEVEHTAVKLGTPGPHRKIIVQLWQKARVAGFLKVATTAAAADKIRNEADILQRLPASLGPELLKVGDLLGARAMLITPVRGKMLPAALPRLQDGGRMGEGVELLDEIRAYQEKLQVGDTTYPIEEHPRIRWIRSQITEAGRREAESGGGAMGRGGRLPVSGAGEFDQMLLPLRKQKWPVVIQHGDFAPWNVLRLRSADSTRNDSDGKERSLPEHGMRALCAIDWEEGTTEGFPNFDLIHYMAQTAALVLGWSARRSATYINKALRYVEKQDMTAVTRLGLLHCYLAGRNALAEDLSLLAWKKAVFEELQ